MLGVTVIRTFHRGETIYAWAKQDEGAGPHLLEQAASCYEGYNERRLQPFRRIECVTK